MVPRPTHSDIIVEREQAKTSAFCEVRLWPARGLP